MNNLDSANPEQQRLNDTKTGQQNWKFFGPYLSERQWGTVREDYSPHGNAWEYLPHDHARSRAYRWGEDGIAGFCDDLKVYRSGIALGTTCKSGADQPPRKIWLNADQLVQLYTWLDTLQTSDGKQSDSAVADSMTVTWTLSANGNRKPTLTEEQKIMEFASLISLSK